MSGKVHFRAGGTHRTKCGHFVGEDGRIKVGTGSGDVTCNVCRRAMGWGETWAQQHGRGLRRMPAKAVDALITRMFQGTEAQLAQLRTNAHKALKTWDDADRDDLASAGENMADVIRGFLSILEDKDNGKA